MNERLKELRKETGLNVRDFSARLGMSSGAISLLENGKRNLTNSFITALCKEYEVNETWLRTGKGSMFLPVDRDKEIAKLVKEILSEEPESFKVRFISAFASLNNEEWKLLEKIIKDIAKENSLDN